MGCHGRQASVVRGWWDVSAGRRRHRRVASHASAHHWHLQAPHAEEVHRPLLSVDRSAGASGKHYLIPVDDSDDSEAALDWAMAMFGQRQGAAEGQGSIFHLLHVVPEPTMQHLWAGVYIPPGAF